MGQPGPAPHRARPVHDADQVEPLEDRGDQRQRPDQEPARGRVQPGESGGQVVQGTGVLEPVPAAQVCHNTMADLALFVAVALHDVHVLVHPAGLADLLETHEHFPNIIAPKLQPCKYLGRFQRS